MVERRGNLVAGGFGRRGGQLLEAPRSATVAAPTTSNAGRVNALPGERLSAGKVIAIFYLTLLALIGLDALLSGTTLITPISPAFINVMRGLGLVLGVPLSLFLVSSPAIEMSMVRKGLALLCVPVLSGFAGGEAAWRIADWIEFPFASTAFVPATYPVTHASSGRRGRRDALEIDPFDVGDSTAIAVPRGQFQSVWRNASDYCITVMQRRSASGAVEILNDGVFNLSQPAPAILPPCPQTKPAQ